MTEQTEKSKIDEILLVSGFLRNVQTKRVIPADVIQLIVVFLRIAFDFDIIPQEYHAKPDYLDASDIRKDVHVIATGDGQAVGVVIDVQSGAIKAGYSADDCPQVIIPNIVGRDKKGKLFIGFEVQQNATPFSLTLSSPVENGDIKDWDAMKAILRRILSKVKGHRWGIAVIMTECLGFAKKSREQLAEFMFTEIGVIAFCCQPRSVLSLYASGRTSGVVVLSDYHCTEIVAIYEGYAMNHAQQSVKMNIGGRDILRYSNKEENQDKPAFDVLFDPRVRELEEQQTYLGLHEYVCQCALKTVAELTSIQRCVKITDFLANIVLSGLGTMDVDSQRLDDALYRKLLGMSQITGNVKIKVVAAPEREHFSWIGASILSSVSTFCDYWMTKTEFLKDNYKLLHAYNMNWSYS